MTTTSGMAVGATRTLWLRLEDAREVLAVGARRHRVCDAPEVVGGNPSHAVGDFLEARDHQSLPLFDRVDVVRRLHERVVRAGVEPGDAACELFDVELT